MHFGFANGDADEKQNNITAFNLFIKYTAEVTLL